MSDDKNKTFSVMAARVDDALQELRDAQSAVHDAERDLRVAQVDRDNAAIEFNKARDALFREHPELAPAPSVSATPPAEPVAPQRPATPEPVMSPQGPLVFRDLDDDFEPGGLG